MKYAFLLSLLIAICLRSEAQLPTNAGNGFIQINLYGYVGLDSTSLGTKDGRLFMEMHHFMRNDKILCSAGSHVASTEVKSDNIVHSLSAEISVPQYVVDLRSGNTTFTTKVGEQAFHCDTPLSHNSFDLFYRKLLNDSSSLGVEVDTMNQSKIELAGKKCKEGKYKTRYGWRSFCYSTDNLGIYSPLNAFVRGFKYPILRLDAELQDDPKDRFKITGIGRFEVEKIDENLQSPDLFQLPSHSIKLPFKAFKQKFFARH